jgi:hypothetical protein
MCAPSQDVRKTAQLIVRACVCVLDFGRKGKGRERSYIYLFIKKAQEVSNKRKNARAKRRLIKAFLFFLSVVAPLFFFCCCSNFV